MLDKLRKHAVLVATLSFVVCAIACLEFISEFTPKSEYPLWGLILIISLISQVYFAAEASKKGKNK